MQTLDFPIRILERGPDDLCILVAHEPLNYHHPEAKEKAKKTREFCNWIRKQFPKVPTEFRYVNKKSVRHSGRKWWQHARRKTVNCDKNFIAYGLSRSEMMLIKLAWSFKTQPIRFETDPTITSNHFVIQGSTLDPSEALKKRIEKNTKVKAVRLV